MTVICFDLDGVLCNQTTGDYEKAIPNQEAIELANQLYDEGNQIIIYTSRFMNRSHNNMIEAYKAGYEFTRQQLLGWGVKFHDLYLGKPIYDVVIDDKAVFFTADWEVIHANLRVASK
jgi:histidinol phosphatase-like enzyme